MACLQVQEQKPASWNALGVQRTLVDDFNHYLFEWPWKNLLIFIGTTYLVRIRRCTCSCCSMQPGTGFQRLSLLLQGFIIVFGILLQLLVSFSSKHCGT